MNIEEAKLKAKQYVQIKDQIEKLEDIKKQLSTWFVVEMSREGIEKFHCDELGGQKIAVAIRKKFDYPLEIVRAETDLKDDKRKFEAGAKPSGETIYITLVKK